MEYFVRLCSMRPRRPCADLCASRVVQEGHQRGELLQGGNRRPSYKWHLQRVPALVLILDTCFAAHSDTVSSTGWLNAQLRHGRAGTIAGVKLWVHIPVGRLIEQAPAARGPALSLSSAGAEQAAEHSCCKDLRHACAGLHIVPTTAACIYSTKALRLPAMSRTADAAPASAPDVTRRFLGLAFARKFIIIAHSREMATDRVGKEICTPSDYPSQNSRSQQALLFRTTAAAMQSVAKPTVSRMPGPLSCSTCKHTWQATTGLFPTRL